MAVYLFPRNLGGPPVSTPQGNWLRGSQHRTPQAPGRRRAVWERRTQAHGVGSSGDTKKPGERGGRASEHSIVPAKQGNRFRLDPGEGRECRVMERLEGNMASASELDPGSTRCQRIAELAKQSPEMGFTSRAHHIDLPWLAAA